jgi:hypothetical protein
MAHRGNPRSNRAFVSSEFQSNANRPGSAYTIPQFGTTANRSRWALTGMSEQSALQ